MSTTTIEGLQNLDGITWDAARLNRACGAPAKLGHLAAQDLSLTETAFAEKFGISRGVKLLSCDLGPIFSITAG